MMIQLLLFAAHCALWLAITPALAAGLGQLIPEILATLAAMLLGACCAAWLAIVVVAAAVRYLRRTASPWLVDTGARA